MQAAGTAGGERVPRVGGNPVNLTEKAMKRWRRESSRWAEGIDAVFSGGKREREEEDDWLAPIIMGRKTWVYVNAAGQGSGGAP
jgi:hypothetical protein